MDNAFDDQYPQSMADLLSRRDVPFEAPHLGLQSRRLGEFLTMFQRWAAFLLVGLCGCAHLELPIPTRPRGAAVVAVMADGFRLSGELVGADADVIVLGDAVSQTHFTCLGRSALSNLASVEGQTVLFPFMALGAASPIAMVPVTTPRPGTPIAAELAELRARARYANAIPDPILKRCSRR